MQSTQSGFVSQTRIILLVFAATIVLQRARLYNAPLHGDICAYAVLGHEMSHGRRLYSDLWERKPPLLYATFAAFESLTGYNRREIFVLSLTTALVTLLLIYQAGKANGRGPIAGVFAAAWWVLMNCDLDLAANQPDPEVFINAWLVGTFLLLVNWPAGKQWFRSVALGLLLSAATLYKHNTALVCLALLIGHWLIPRSQPLRHRLAESFIAGCCMIAIWSAVFGYFACTGRAAVFVEVLFRQNLSYSGSVTHNLITATDRIFPAFMLWAIAPAIVLLVLFLFSCRDRKAYLKPWPDWLMLLAWAIGTFPTIGLTGYLYPHYYQLWLPLGCIAGGWACASLVQNPTRVPPVIGYATLAICFAFLLFRQGSEFLLTPQQWVQRQFPYFNLVAQNKLGSDIGQLLKPDEQFWELGEDNALYFFAKRTPPTGLLFIDPLIYGDQTQTYWDRLLGDLNRSQPALVVISDNWTGFFPPNAPIFPWLRSNYRPWSTPLGWPHYQFLVRRGSDLQARVMPATVSSSVPRAMDAPFPPAHR